MLITHYAEALAYIYSYINYNPAHTAHWSLDRLQELLHRLDNPHQPYPSLLIAGTKGKGSTAAMCETILRAAGYYTGLYTSPHLHSFRERIRLGGELMPAEMLVKLLNRHRAAFENTPGLTTFELITALAFLAFAEAKIEVAVIEVGLGGRLDATNSVNPVVAVITPISYDHMQILGDTLTLIAREKAGIIRPGALVISAPQVDEARQTIEAVCQNQAAHLKPVDRVFKWTIKQTSLEGQTFRLTGHPFRETEADDAATDYWLPLIGEHQVINAMTAMAAVAGFSERTGLAVSPEAVKTGLATVRWPGRLEVLHRRPYLVVDSAMNGDSAEKLAQALRSYFPAQTVTFIFGVSYDHPVKDMLRALLPLARQIFVVASNHPRAEQPANLVEMVAELGQQAIPMPDVPQALAHVWAKTQPDELVCVTGSLFLAADAREAWLRQNGLPLPPVDPKIEIKN